MMQYTMNKIHSSPTADSTTGILEDVARRCTRCRICVKDCAFLKKYGTPGEIAASFNPEHPTNPRLPHECSLCGLCGHLCPQDIDPAAMFLELRRDAVKRGRVDFRKYSRLLAYEKAGISRLFSWYSLPRGCTEIFFPGCALPGSRPGAVLELYRAMKERIPGLGIVLDCCTKPSHDLGREDFFRSAFGAMSGFLRGRGITRVHTACPNCHKVFSRYGEGMETRTVYEFLDGISDHDGAWAGSPVTLHDPCALRDNERAHASVRSLAAKKGLSVREMKHSGTGTLCCGEGGTVGALDPALAAGWTALRSAEAGDDTIITYCAGCANFLGARSPVRHILDLYFGTRKGLRDGVGRSLPLVPYLRRLLLKRRIKKEFRAAFTGERPMDRIHQ